MADKLLKVGELAKAVGKTVRALHLYEEMGLLAPVSRSSGGYRLYGADAVARVNWISTLQTLGFSLPQIKSFLSDWEGAETGPKAMARVRAVFEEKLRETREAKERLARLEKELEASLAYLESCVARCEPTHDKRDCQCCTQHGHDPAGTPELVAGLAASSAPARARGASYHVPVSNLSRT